MSAIEDDIIPPYDYIIESRVVNANRRYLTGDWTMESSEDLQSLHGINVEQELAVTLSEEISGVYHMRRYPFDPEPESCEDLTEENDEEMYLERLGI